jgi:hypothetical protein
LGDAANSYLTERQKTRYPPGFEQRGKKTNRSFARSAGPALEHPVAMAARYPE